MTELNLLLNEEREKSLERIKRISDARHAYADLIRMHDMMQDRYGNNIPPEILATIREEAKILSVKFGANSAGTGHFGFPEH